MAQITLCSGGHHRLQFQPPVRNSNGALFTCIFDAELKAGRYPVVLRSEVLNRDTGLRWRS